MIQIVKDDTLYLINDSGVVSAMADAVIEAKQGESFDASEVPAEEAETEAEA